LLLLKFIYNLITKNKIINIDGTSEFVTVIEGVCADGTVLNPTIIFKVEEFKAEWFQRVRGIPENSLFDRLQNG